jgi:hypothetical protein
VSGIANTLPAIALVDVFGSVLLQRNGVVQVRLQCTPPVCSTDLNAAFDLITMTIEVVNGSTSVAQIVFLDNNQIVTIAPGAIQGIMHYSINFYYI